MPAQVRLSKKELIDLIEETEAASCDTTCLRGLLAEVEEEERRRKPPRREVPPRVEPVEMTIEEYLVEKRAQSQVEHGTDLECMICHDRFDHLLSGACEVCWREWMLSTKPRG
ncbi:hypothetical protein ES705_35230 [subsurface metagenome]